MGNSCWGLSLMRAMMFVTWVDHLHLAGQQFALQEGVNRQQAVNQEEPVGPIHVVAVIAGAAAVGDASGTVHGLSFVP